MAPITRARSKEIWDKLVSQFLDRDNETTFKDALTHIGISELESLATMDLSDIEHLKVRTTVGSITQVEPFDRGQKRKIEVFLRFITKKKLESTIPIDAEFWESLSTEEYGHFVQSFVFPDLAPAGYHPNAGNNANARQLQEVEYFKRSIKRDATIYPTLREDLGWDNWNRNVLTLARTHNVIEVFDSTYKPNDSLESELFKQKQAFVYSVFVRTVLTDMGKTIVRQYEQSYDAQQVYKELVDYAKRSTAANINIDNIVQQLYFMKLDSRWTGTTKGFILN